MVSVLTLVPEVPGPRRRQGHRDTSFLLAHVHVRYLLDHDGRSRSQWKLSTGND